MIQLTPGDLAIAAGLLLVLGGLSIQSRLRMEKQLLVAAVRTVVQLLLIGTVLKSLFSSSQPGLVAGVAVVMLLAAGREVRARQKRPVKGLPGFALGTGAMFLSSFSVAVVALTVIVQPSPWYQPQYAIPFLGMLLGNTITGVALCTDRFTQLAVERRGQIEQRLLLGQDKFEATLDLRREALRTGLTPIINAMAAAGLVSLPGMMTGQILAGSPPIEAAKYQILIMFLIAAGTGFGTLGALHLTFRTVFDRRDRLCLDRLGRKK